MRCPRCQNRLRELQDGSLLCWKCELHRKPADRVLVRAATQHWIIKRNLDRVPPGSEVEIYNCNNQLAGSLGVFKEQAGEPLALKSKTGFVLATSMDIEDLAILIVENEWYAQGPESLLAILNLLEA